MNRTIRAATSGLLALCLISGCGPKQSPTSNDAAVSARIPLDGSTSPSAVVVNVDEGQLSPERRAAFEKLNGPTRLVAAVREEMARQQRVPAPPVQLALTVTEFRIRSTATSVWFGAMAGADVLDVQTVAAKDGQILAQWKTGAGSIVGGLIRPGIDGRFERLISTTAQRIVAGL